MPVQQTRHLIRLPHRAEPLQVEAWVPVNQRRDGLWLALMPGLGGNPEHIHWLARRVAGAGWPVALLEHPGSDAAAVQALLEGRQPFDGTKALKQRLQDLPECCRLRSFSSCHSKETVLFLQATPLVL